MFLTVPVVEALDWLMVATSCGGRVPNIPRHPLRYDHSYDGCQNHRVHNCTCFPGVNFTSQEHAVQASVERVEGTTTLRFTRIFDENFNSTSDIDALVAYSSLSNTLGAPHDLRGSFVLTRSFALSPVSDTLLRSDEESGATNQGNSTGEA